MSLPTSTITQNKQTVPKKASRVQASETRARAKLERVSKIEDDAAKKLQF